MKKERIDVLCVEQGLFESREKAKRAIMAGIVRDDYDYIDKPGTKIPVDSHLYIKGEQLPYVSRGGLKLEKALKEFQLDIQNLIMLDIGSSTGGFTDCALQNGAKEVYACCSHGILTDPAVQRIQDSCIKQLVITNTIPLDPAKKHEKIVSISLAPMLAEFIRCIYENEPVSNLFDKNWAN